MFSEKWRNPLKSSACNVWVPRWKCKKKKKIMQKAQSSKNLIKEVKTVINLNRNIKLWSPQGNKYTTGHGTIWNTYDNSISNRYSQARMRDVRGFKRPLWIRKTPILLLLLLLLLLVACHRGWWCMWIYPYTPYVDNLGNFLREEEKGVGSDPPPPPSPRSATYSWLARHHCLEQIVKHLPWRRQKLCVRYC